MAVNHALKRTGKFYDAGGGAFNIQSPKYDGGAKGDGVADDTGPLLAFQADLEAAGDGARGIIPAGTYLFDEQLAPLKANIYEGGIVGPDNVGAHRGPTLKWMGSGATVPILFSGTGCTGAQLRGIALDMGGDAPIGLQIDTGHVKIVDFGIVRPTVAFSEAAVVVGRNGEPPNVKFDNLNLWNAGLINLILEDIGTFMHVKGGTIMDPATGGTVSVQVGGSVAGKRASYVHFDGTTFESITADAVNVQVLQARLLAFTKAYFEITGANGVAIDIPSTAVLAQGVVAQRCRFGAISGSPWAVRSNFASALLSIEDSLLDGTFTGLFNNLNVRHARIAKNKYIGGGLTWASSRKNVTLYQNEQTGSTPVRDDGYFIERETTNTTAASNIGTGEDDLMSYSLPANRLYENGQVLRITAFGSTAANANNKRVRLYVAGTLVLDSAAVAANNVDWVLKATVIRTANTTAQVIAEGQFNGVEIAANHIGIVPASTGWDAAQILKVTGEATADSDIVQRGLLVEVSN